MREFYTITELTREFGVSTRTLRFYEDEGLLQPLRRGRQRLYRPRERTRLMLILRGRRVGLSLKEIGEILAMYEREPGERGQLAHLLGRIGELRATFEARARDLAGILAELDELEAGCRARLAAIAGGGTGAGDGL